MDKQSGLSGRMHTKDDVRRALLDLTDMLEMAMLPYVLLGDIAKAMVDGHDGISGDDIFVPVIEVGLYQRNMTPEVLSLFRTWKFNQTDYGYTYTFSGVPVELHVIKRRYNFFEQPDQRFFGPDVFTIPNPFDKYWKARFIIQ